MHSKIHENTSRSFIEEARRAQIIEATIDVLGQLGYAQTSLAKIAKKASISTSLILYHFKDREELVGEVLDTVIFDWNTYIADKLTPISDLQERLRVYIEASIAYMGTHPQKFAAMIDIMFTARDKNGHPVYLSQKKDDQMRYVETTYLEELFIEGQKNNTFTSFNPLLMAVMVRGCIDQYLGYLQAGGDVELEEYAAHLVKSITSIVSKEGRD